MFGRTSLLRKMVFSLAGILAILALVGFVGLRSAHNVRSQLGVYAHWGVIDMGMNEDVIQNVLKIDAAAQRAAADGDWNLVDGALGSLREGLASWREAASTVPDLVEIAAEAEEAVKQYARLYEQYREHQRKRSASEQASGLQEISSSLEELSAMLIEESQGNAESGVSVSEDVEEGSAPIMRWLRLL